MALHEGLCLCKNSTVILEAHSVLLTETEPLTLTVCLLTAKMPTESSLKPSEKGQVNAAFSWTQSQLIFLWPHSSSLQKKISITKLLRCEDKYSVFKAPRATCCLKNFCPWQGELKQRLWGFLALTLGRHKSKERRAEMKCRCYW